MANMLNCKLGVLPLKYLSIPISNHHLGIAASSEVLSKMVKRLDPWGQADTDKPNIWGQADTNKFIPNQSTHVHHGVLPPS